MYRGLRLGRIADVEINVDWSLLIIFLLITFGLATSLLPTWHPQWSAGVVWVTAVCAAILFFGSVLAHELSHAMIGRRGGVEVRRITLFVFGGMAHMENEPPSWGAELRMAIAGPIVSFLIGIACLALVTASVGAATIEAQTDPLELLAQLSPLATVLLWLGWINVVLAIFNLVPGFPLDGGRVLRAILWGVTGNHLGATRIASLMGQAFAWILIAAGFVMLLGGTVPFFGRGFLGGLWLVLIGWFLNNAALLSYRNLVVINALDHVPAFKLMRLLPTRLDPDLTLQALADHHVMASGQPVFPVEDGERFLGWVTLDDLRRSNPASRHSRRVADAMQPAAKLPAVTPDQNVSDATQLMRRHESNHIPVVDSGRLLGVLTQEDLAKWLSLRGDREQREGRFRASRAETAEIHSSR